MSNESVATTASIPSYCEQCELKANPKAGCKGSPGATYMFVGDWPSVLEARIGNIFSGHGGQLLMATLKAAGVKQEDIFLTTTLKCNPGTSAKVNYHKCCNARLMEEIATVKPKVLVALGAVPAKVLLGASYSISEIRGRTYWSKEFNCYIIPTYHPSAIMQNPEWFHDFSRDIEKAIAAKDLAPGGIKRPVLKWTMHTEVETALEFLNRLAELQEETVVSLDIETDGFDYFSQDILAIGMSTDEDVADTFTKKVIEDPRVQEAMTRACANPHIIWVLQNGKFDVQYLRADPDPEVFGYKKNVVIPTARCDYDTMLAHYCTDERQGTHGLKSWAKEEFDEEDYESEIKIYLPNKDTPYSNIPEPVLHKYLAHDCTNTRKGYFRFNEKMAKEGTDRYFWTVLMPGSKALTEIELYGVLLDVPKLTQLFKDAQPKIDEARKNLEREAIKAGWSPERYCKDTGAKEKPKFFNPNSHPQMSYVAYDLCKMPLFEGKKTCNKAAVEAYQFRHPFWKAIAQYKQITDLFGIYVKGMLERVDKDNRIRPDFLLHGTVTGRLSCHDPNLQNIPRKSFVKDMFIAPEGSVICNMDYKTLEVVVAALLSDDPEMKKPFILGEDFHMNTTRDVFGEDLAMLKEWKETENVEAFIDYLHKSMMLEIRMTGQKYIYDMGPELESGVYAFEEDPSKWKIKDSIDFGKLEDLIVDYLRFLTKFITFGIMYGRKAPSLANGELNCSVAEAQKYIDNFHKKYKGFSRWIKEQERKAIKEGYVTTLFGHKRRWPFITNDLIYSIKNQAVNTPIQGTAAQITLLSVVGVHEEFKKTTKDHVLFTVHDSIVSELKRETLFQSLDIIESIATHPPLDTDLPFKIDLEIGPSYGRVEGIKKVNGVWVPSKPDKASPWLTEVLRPQLPA